MHYQKLLGYTSDAVRWVSVPGDSGFTGRGLTGITVVDQADQGASVNGDAIAILYRDLGGRGNRRRYYQFVNGEITELVGEGAFSLRRPGDYYFSLGRLFRVDDASIRTLVE